MLAVYLGQKGKQVTVIEMLGDIATDINRSSRMQLMEMMNEVNVKVLTSTKLIEVTEGGIAAESNSKRENVEAATIALAISLKAETALAEELQISVLNLYAIVDCVEPRKIINAIWEAYRTACLIQQ